MGAPTEAATAISGGGVGQAGGGRPMQERLSEQERGEIVAAIDQSQGNIAHAARRLGINRSTLYYRLRKHGLEHLLPMKEPAAATATTGGAATPSPIAVTPPPVVTGGEAS
jgi:transposase-like protein